MVWKLDLCMQISWNAHASVNVKFENIHFGGVLPFRKLLLLSGAFGYAEPGI